MLAGICISPTGQGAPPKRLFEATVSLDPITGDNVVTVEETVGSIAVTGAVGGDVRTGDTVTVAVNGIEFSGPVLGGGVFSINVPGSEFTSDADRRIEARVVITDAGNTVTAFDSRQFSIDTGDLDVGLSVDGHLLTDDEGTALQAA